MTNSKPVLAIEHKLSLSVGGIVRYRIKVPDHQTKHIETLQFRIKNTSPIYRNITPGSGPWKISVALIRHPDKTPAVPELVPSIGCAQVCRLDGQVHDRSGDLNNKENKDKDEAKGSDHDNDNEWELEIISEMVLQPNWVNIQVEVYAVPRRETSLEGNRADTSREGGTDTEVQPRVLLPHLISCEYQDTTAICGPTFPKREQQEANGDDQENDMHLVLLTHGIHGTWLDMLYIKEQIDAQNRHHGKTVTFLTDTNHAGTEEGIQMAGRRVALDILEFTGYCDTEAGQNLRKSFSTVTRKKSLSKTGQNATSSNATTAPSAATTSTASLSPSSSASSSKDGDDARANKSAAHRNAISVFPRGFSKVSIIGHSLGGLINIYALGYIEDVTKGAFFKTIQPVHFITLATPLLGIGFEHPWVLGLALSWGVVGQTGKDLALEDRSGRLKRSASIHSSSSSTSLSSAGSESGTLSSSSSKSSKHNSFRKKEVATAGHATKSSPTSSNTDNSNKAGPPECALDRDPEPLLLAMARPGSVSNRVLRQFSDRTSYANIENDMAVRFNTSSMMGIPQFDMDHFFSPEGKATQPRKNLYHSALTSTMALLFPNVPTKAKFLSIQDAPSPIVVVSHVGPASVTAAEVNKKTEETGAEATAEKAQDSNSHQSTASEGSLTTAMSSAVASKSRQDLAHLVAEGYHAEMDWTKIGVFIEHEAHVQIIVRRKWYNLEGWKCVQDLVERFDFT
ncbi:hypothetical protein EDD11_005371 [Mortierella claussenii]|nr:hypothetical protein EDD11_005371 [Mortierella claussenii]